MSLDDFNIFEKKILKNYFNVFSSKKYFTI